MIKEKETPERVPGLNKRLNQINIELRDRKREGERKREEGQVDTKEILHVTYLK